MFNSGRRRQTGEALPGLIGDFEIDEFGGEAQLLGDQAGEGTWAKGFGGVVARENDVLLQVLGLVVALKAGLAGEVGVEAEIRGLVDHVRRAA